MCGIFALFAKGQVPAADLMKCLECLRHRGPDNSRLSKIHPNLYLGFTRLAIMSPEPDGPGMQPFVEEEVHLICNGEIYNYKELAEQYQITLTTGSDCEILLKLYLLWGRNEAAVLRITEEIDAEFAFILFDRTAECLYVARDFGIRPLFQLLRTDGSLAFASEVKALQPLRLTEEDRIQPFPPHTLWVGQFRPASDSGDFISVHSPRFLMECHSHQDVYYVLPRHRMTHYSEKDILAGIRARLVDSVAHRLVADVPLGALLSGGLDSSLICAIAARLLPVGQKLRTFAIGLVDSPDLVAAQKVADHIGSNHTSVVITPAMITEAVIPVIRAIESYDTTTIRASIPHYLLCQYIRRETDIRVVLSGEGSDELFMGYLFNHLPATEEQAELASDELCRDLYLYDCLRSDRATSAASLEGRFPFLQKNLVDYALRIPGKLRKPQYVTPPLEKYLLRQAFLEGNYLPVEILMRRKAAFSDAVGLSMVDLLKLHAEQQMSDWSLAERSKQSSDKTEADVSYAHCPPRTVEEAYYRSIFDQHYPGLAASLLPDFWRPRFVDSSNRDPSARILPCFQE